MNKRPRGEDGWTSRKIAKRDIEQLPHDMLRTVFGYLALHELLVVARVCARWRDVSRERDFWKKAELLIVGETRLRDAKNGADPPWTWWAQTHRLPVSLDGDFRWILRPENASVLFTVGCDWLSGHSEHVRMLRDVRCGRRFETTRVNDAVILKMWPLDDPETGCAEGCILEEGYCFFIEDERLRVQHFTFPDEMWSSIRAHLTLLVMDKVKDPQDIVYDESGPGLAIRVAGPSAKK